jgi:hypothetical protein
MEAKIASCNFTKYIKRGPDRWQHCPVVRGRTGRVKPDLALVEGRIEHHPEGYYSLDRIGDESGELKVYRTEPPLLAWLILAWIYRRKSS